MHVLHECSYRLESFRIEARKLKTSIRGKILFTRDIAKLPEYLPAFNFNVRVSPRESAVK
jgi:hypothetical protein